MHWSLNCKRDVAISYTCLYVDKYENYTFSKYQSCF